MVGVMAFEQTSLFFLLPFIKREMALTNSQAGLLGTVYFVAFALSSWLAGPLADRGRGRKAALIVIIAATSLFSVLSAAVHSYASLFAVRLLMGLLEGPVLPLAQSILALESPAKRRALNMGIVGSLIGNLFGGLIAPLTLIHLASSHGWRAGFLLVAAPGLVSAALAALILHQPSGQPVADEVSAPAPQNGMFNVLALTNVWQCACIGCCFAAYLSVGIAFIPLFYSTGGDLTPGEIALLMSTAGISAITYSVIVPMASNWIGRRRAMVAAYSLGIIPPLAAISCGGAIALLGPLMFFGWAISGTGSLSYGTIPSESVDPSMLSRAIGLIVALGTLGGGLLGPTIAGWSADVWGPRAPLLVMVTIGVTGALISLCLTETAPKRIQQRRSPQAPASPANPLFREVFDGRRSQAAPRHIKEM